MATIVFKSVCGMDFKLKNEKVIKLQGQGILNIISEDDLGLLLEQYGNFIKPRILTDKNPLGCFIIASSVDYAKDMSEEVGDEVKDKSAPIKVEGGEFADVKLEDLESAVIEATSAESAKKVKSTKKKK